MAERIAREVIAAFGDAGPDDYPERLSGMLVRRLREYGAECARLQRHACADAVFALDLCDECPEAATYTRNDAYNAVLATEPPETP